MYQNYNKEQQIHFKEFVSKKDSAYFIKGVYIIWSDELCNS